MKSRRNDLTRGDNRIDALEKELARVQVVSRSAKEYHEQTQAELSRIASTGISFVQVIDELGITLQDAITSAASRLSKRS